MKKEKLVLIIFFLNFFCSSCRYGVNINIENKSDTQIDSIVVSNDFQKVKLNDFEKKKSHNFYFDFKNARHKGDGIFIIQVYKNSKSISETFGYFSNGVPPNNNFQIDIYKDVLKVIRIK